MENQSRKISTLKRMGSFLSMVWLLVKLVGCTYPAQEIPLPRVLVSTDIGGTDPDDFQSMIHLLMYGDMVRIEGLVSSPYGEGRKEDILDIVDLYESDYRDLVAQAPGLPLPSSIRRVTKQGATRMAPYEGYSEPSEGSNWIVKCAKESTESPLWVLVWGGLEDVAQALHDAPEIKKHIRVYWIGGPNKKWSINAYSYIASQHPDLWMIEANATYRGWILDVDSPDDLKGNAYYGRYIKGRGAMGEDFGNYYEGNIKMGDTPSLAYLLDGDPNDPEGESWGGSFTRIDRSSRYVFEGGSSQSDTVAAYGTIEWIFDGPEISIPTDSVVFHVEIQGQVWPGYYLGRGKYGVKYASKKPEIGKYRTSSKIQELNGLEGGYVSIEPWPGQPKSTDYTLGDQWFSDKKDARFFLKGQQGAKTISIHRKEFLLDWAQRWDWLSK